jgi:hypothetical protein
MIREGSDVMGVVEEGGNLVGAAEGAGFVALDGGVGADAVQHVEEADLWMLLRVFAV